MNEYRAADVLDALRAELEAQRDDMKRQCDQYRDGGDPLQAHAYAMAAVGLEKAIRACEQALRRELKALSTR